MKTILFRDAAVTPLRHSRGVFEVKPSFDSHEPEREMSNASPDKREFSDTSTWEQIIRVLEETSAEQ